MKCDGFLSFLRENGDNLKIHIVKPVMQKPLKHGNWLAEEIIDKPMLFSVGSSVIEDFIGQEPCNECKARHWFDAIRALSSIMALPLGEYMV